MFTDLKDPELRYRVSEELHRTANVWSFRGVDEESGQPTTVKVIGIGSAADATVYGRVFRDRCAILERLDHESMPRLLDAGLTESGNAYLVFEWLEGRPAASLAPMSPRQALPLVTRVLEGLECLALHNLVHWNVTPETIVVSPEGDARLVGLGVSLLPIEWWNSHRVAMSTPDRYVAPEFRSLDLGPTAALGGAWWKGDLYSASMTTCDLLGALVENAGTDRPRVRLPTWEAHPLLGVLERCLHGDPACRPISFSEVINAFHAALVQEGGTSDFRVVRGAGRTEDPTPHPAAEDLSSTNLFPKLWLDRDERDDTPSGMRALRRPRKLAPRRIPARPLAPVEPPEPRSEDEETKVIDFSTADFSLDAEPDLEATRPLRVEPLQAPLPEPEQPVSVPPVPTADGPRVEPTRPTDGTATQRPVEPRATPLRARPEEATVVLTSEEESAAARESSAAASGGRVPGSGAVSERLRASRLPARGASALAIAALVLMITVALWPSSDAESTGGVAAEPDLPPPVDELIGGVEPPPLELRTEISRAYELFADGDHEGALALLDELEAEDGDVLLTPLECDQISILRESVARIEAIEIENGLRRALVQGDRRSLAAALDRIGEAELLYLNARPGAPDVLERGRALVQQLDDYDRSIRGEQFVEAFDQAERIAARYPEVEQSMRLRDRAAIGIEQRIDHLLVQGKWELAAQAIEMLESRWPDRPGLLEREATLNGALQSVEEWDRLYAALAAMLDGSHPHEGLERLAALEPPFEQVARFGDLRDQLQAKLDRLDAESPTLELTSAREFRRGQEIVVELRAEDDYEVVGTTLWMATSADAVYREVPLERRGDGVWAATIPVAEHADRPVTLYAETVDRSGHSTSLASAEAPIEIKRRRWWN